MLRRPQPADSEEDLLREQQQFLTSGAPAAATVVRRPDKRRGEEGGVKGKDDAQDRDVVTIEDLPDQLPSLTPAPPKKSRFKANRVTFEDEDVEERLDRHDSHVSAVLSKIVERDTSCTPISLPALTGMPFPKVLHRSETDCQGPHSLSRGKKSIFARQIAAQRLKEGAASVCTPETVQMCDSSMETDQCRAADERPRLVSGQGLVDPDSTGETQRIHRENQAKLQGMSQSEILDEQKKLLSQLDPRLVKFIRSQKAQSVPSSTSPSKLPRGGSSRENIPLENVSKQSDSLSAAPEPQEVTMEGEGEEEGVPRPPAVMEEVLPVRPQKDWVHMDKVEPEKLEWMRDLPAPRKKGTKKAMQARFNFAGTLIPPNEDVPTHLGLHHHGEEPERAGYSLQELFMLSRSQFNQQRMLALSTLANILSKARAEGYTSVLKGSVLSVLLDAGLLFLLRFALDDSVEGVMSAAVHALRAFLVCAEDEECLDGTFSWFRGLASFPLLPSAQDDEDEEDEGVPENLRESAKEREARKSDYDVARQDVVKGLLKMKLLPRLRYILEVVRPSPRVVQDVLEILTRIARHSSSSATQVLDCPRLMETLLSEFFPTSWTAPSLTPRQSAYGFPLASAMKLLRVVATSGRHACARLLNSFGVTERLSHVLSIEPSELLLEESEAVRITAEAYRLWAVAAGYGQACKLFIELYPSLAKSLQSVHRVLDSSNPLLPLQIQRVQALLSLLTQVTNTAGCHQELQTSMVSSQGHECPPPPPVSWGHITGLQPSLLGHLKGFVKNLDNPLQKESSLAVIPTYLAYLHAYYQQLSKQSCFKPVETLQELELLTSDVLRPLISHHAVQALIKNLKSSSVVCNAQSSHVSHETIPSLPGLACHGWRDHPGLVASSSPFPLLTGLGFLLDTIMDIHKGLCCKFADLLLSEPVTGYLRSCSQATPTLVLGRAWLLRHEHYLLYLLLRLAHRLVPVEPQIAKHASLYHQVALVLLPWLLPGSESMAHELFSTIVFSKDFISEGHSGGPEAVELGELKLQEQTEHTSPSLQTVGALLRDACVQLPSIRGCFLTHLAHLEPSVLTSRDALLGRSPWVKSHLLPELTGPILPSDWPFLPLVSLYEQTGVSGSGGLEVEVLPQGALQSVTHCLQWLLVLEVWREEALKVVPPVAKLARLSCVFLCSSDLFLERPVQKLTWGLFRLLTRQSRLDSLDLNVPPPGLASFQDLYLALLTQYEAVSFGDRLFGCWLLLPLQRRYSATMKLAVFGEHVGMLRSLGVTIEQLSIPIERFTSPAEDSLPLLRLYFRSLVTGTLAPRRCPVLYVVALSHVNAFIFSQDAAAQEVETARQSMLRKIYYLTDEVLKTHLLLFRLPQRHSEFGFDVYDQLPPIRAKRLENILQTQESSSDQRD
ncbi:RNA polymerase II-associated protein 1 [Takifugu rubripes]|uniref:RNA polymerase II associated protein 1 n=1 Tax=Takifugu rubripes TaxID=31033 RepID=H2UAQ7_TAKRU|nr:RNA polymerase II-associated protein 1 [Takifugu rubripes]XP_011616051.2 RNA polymerase II-associated protein 1 [Takifugu rubripes]XP_029688603.1 RNA polymerase II-associated protein 1 [Takifugu rubripes]